MLFDWELFPYRGCGVLQQCWHEPPHCAQHIHSTAACTSSWKWANWNHRMGEYFRLQTVISELVLWVVTLEGYISYQCVGGAQGRGWIEEKREQWMIEFTQSCGSQCNCVGLHLCLPRCRKSHLGSDFNCPHAPLKPKLSHCLKETGKNRWGKENGMMSVLGRRRLGIKAIFINKEQWGSSQCDLVGIYWFCCGLVFCSACHLQ